MGVLIDTSVLVELERGGLRLDQVLRPDELYAISVVSAAELLHVVHRGSGRQAQARSASVERLLATLPVVPVDLPVARAYAMASAEMARAGLSADANDLWIAATAIAHGMEVLALDRAFGHVPGVTVSAPQQG